MVTLPPTCAPRLSCPHQTRARGPGQDLAAADMAPDPTARHPPVDLDPGYARRASLAARFPTVAAQWHPTRNPTRVTPETISAKSGLMVWWRCRRGHEWEQQVSARVSTAPLWKNGNPAACPTCIPSPAPPIPHLFGCGHTIGITRRAANSRPTDRCPDCE